MASSRGSLRDDLVANIPEGVHFNCYHISTPPTRCEALYSPPPGRDPEKTYSESHSLLISIPTDGRAACEDVAVFAIELILYTTAKLTTLFVSKADSTGFASLLGLPKTSGSILQSSASTFISWLVHHRHRPDRRLVLSLFARAQDQYLFPGSVENPGKHILDDRGLVKWWCKTLDSIVRSYPLEETRAKNKGGDVQIQSKAYLIVPGQDKHETGAFFPPTARADEIGRKRWINDHPLQQICSDPFAPPRCLVPHFPDDPKSRFLLELDEEISDAPSSQSTPLTSPIKRGLGLWKSVRTLEQFWEMMAFRQECSSGRLVGFIWIVFSPSDIDDPFRDRDASLSPSPIKRKAAGALLGSQSPKQPKIEKRKHPLSGPIVLRAPRIKPSDGSARKTDPRPDTTRHYHSPANTRGALVLTQKDYDRVHEMLLKLDFAYVEVACASTRKWAEETAVISGTKRRKWGLRLVGMKPPEKMTDLSNGGPEPVNIIGRKKRKDPPALQDDLQGKRFPELLVAGVNVLGNSLVRKKPKLNVEGEVAVEQPKVDSGVNLLGGGLVRKKDKPAT